MKRPLTGLAVVFASGIWLESLLSLRWEWLCCGVIGLLVAFFMAYRTRGSLPVLLGLVLVTGMFSYRQATTVFPPHYVTRLVAWHDQNISLRGLIVSDLAGSTNHAENAQGDRQRFTLQLTAIQTATNWIQAAGRVLVFLEDRGAGAMEPLRYGDQIECAALMRVPTPARNPGTFDWPSYLQRRNIAFTATIRRTDLCTILAHGQGNPFIALSLRMQERFKSALRCGLENEPKLAGALAGMIIGQREAIAPDTFEDFQQTGVFHVFAINGLHVGLVTVILLVFLRLVRIPRRWCGLAGIPLLALYVFATGAHPGAVRALVMASVWLLSWMLVRPTNGLSNLAAAALVLLIWEPTQLFDGGFLLSFTVVAAIVVLTPRIEERMNRLVAPDPFLPRRFVSKWRRAAENPAARYGVRLLSCSLAAWLGLVPLLAVYFHLFTPVSIVANLLVIPLLTAIISFGLTATLAHAVWPWLTLTLNNANLLLLAIMTRGVKWLSEMPFGHWFVQAPPTWLVVAYYGLGLVLLSRLIPLRWRLVTLATGVVLGGALVAAGLCRDTVELTVLSLSDGPAIFLNAPGERNDWLIDGGGNWDGARVLPPFLRAQGVDRLGAIVLTRDVESHAGGLSAVLSEIPVAQALHADAPSRSKYGRQWLAMVNERGIPLRTLRAGDALSAGNHVRVKVLHPPRETVSTRSDENALVLAIEVGPTRVLLMSDTGETVERRLLESGTDVRAAVIVRGQNKKESCCSTEFLAAAQPEVVVLTVNTRPNNREPEPVLRERLKKHGVKLLCTDETGAVTILLTGRGYQLRTFWPGDS